MRYFLIAGFWACGCKFSSSGVVIHDADVPDAEPKPDVEEVPDMTSCDPSENSCCGTPPNVVNPRECHSETRSAICVGEQPAPGRTCPGEGKCDELYDDGPMACVFLGCQSCVDEPCDGDAICAPFVKANLGIRGQVSYQLAPCCVAKGSGKGTNEACTNDDLCQSGLCIGDEIDEIGGEGDGVGFCFGSCEEGCPLGGECCPFSTYVDGFLITVLSCFSGECP